MTSVLDYCPWRVWAFVAETSPGTRTPGHIFHTPILTSSTLGRYSASFLLLVTKSMSRAGKSLDRGQG